MNEDLSLILPKEQEEEQITKRNAHSTGEKKN